MDALGDIRAGAVLADRFRVHSRLGSGGTATVFLAEDCVLCRQVAIKRLDTEGSESDLRRFRREARIGASLIHPNLVTIFDTVSGSDGSLIVMEHVRGRPLSEIIPPDGMDSRRLLEILRPVASAIDYAHEHGVVHRDVKPANILIGEDRRVKLVDLGTATAGHLTQITTENEVVGTLAYIAPERLAGESVGEPPADVYSLAIVAFEGLTGRQPRRAETPGELLSQALRDPAPEVVDALPDAASSLGRVLAQGMHPDPERRQASASAFIRDIEAALPDRGKPREPEKFPPTERMTVPLTQERPRPAPSPRPAEVARVRGHGWVLPALACLSLLLGGIAWLVFSGGSGENGGGAGGDGRAPNTTAGGVSPAEGPATQASQSAAKPAAGTSAAAPQSASTVDPSAGAALNEEGYSLIQHGRYDEAVRVLRRAVGSFPEGTTDINYAYALFNLGHALRMAGRPEAAIPVLEQRLRIPDQTEIVQREIEAARAAAGQ
jgi:tetratricopeptide (TPR) repeat protein/predicted Ser/Thr protein kinase